uniref:Uncharacterized protein n=1 Tax=Oryzias sinensis TaxID=183150 RepID=A0A8C7YDA3_9TELE
VGASSALVWPLGGSVCISVAIRGQRLHQCGLEQEWAKHGACAACVEGFNSPQKYFQISLKLRKWFEIQRVLEDAGIAPSCERRYKDRQVWFQVKIRLSRDLTLGCPHPEAGSGPGSGSSPGHPCPPEVPFFYLPINHQQPERPCD